VRLRTLLIAAAIGVALGPAITRASLQAQFPAVTVRGRLLRNPAPPYGQVPAVNVCVTVNNQVLGRSGAACTGPDGMYYLSGIPGGVYNLEIWVTVPPGYDGRLPNLAYGVTVVPNGQPLFDIAPITIP
jgi:hypothetical protein